MYLYFLQALKYILNIGLFTAWKSSYSSVFIRNYFIATESEPEIIASTQLVLI